MPTHAKKTKHAKHHRSFVLVTASGKTKGRYISTTPAGAARKIGNRLLKEKKSLVQKRVTVRVHETTQGSLKKTFVYIVRRVKLDKPRVVVRKGKRVTYKFKTVVKSKK